jgi:hypothetical protein
MGSDGSIWAWGGNGYGRLGDGTTESRLTPVKIRDGGSWRVATPTLSPAGGSFTAAQAVTIAVATPGATIRYTTNGADPTPADATITSGSSIAVDVSQTVKAKAWKADLADGAVASETYTLTVATPTMSPGTGTYETPQTVTISCSTPGATLRFTTTGVDPTPSDPVIVSGGSVFVDATQTVKVKAWKGGWENSAVGARAYTLAVAAPVLTPGPGSYAGGQAVTVTTATPGATLTYTTTGRVPTPADAVIASGGTLQVDGNRTITVVGWRTGWTPSAVTRATYQVVLGTAATPVLEPAPGTYAGSVAVRLSSSTPGATIRFTLDGSEPTLTSSVYVGPLLLDAATTVKARAFAASFDPSPTVSGAYAVTGAGAVSAPVLTPGPGRYATSPVVQAMSPTSGAEVRYTTDGSEPDIAHPTVGVGVAVERSLVLRAKGWKTGLAASRTASGFYLVTGALAVGEGHVLALRADGSVFSFGVNYDGQLGNGTRTGSGTPATIAGLSGVVAVAAGQHHSLALDGQGRVWAWGSNVKGQLGDGTTVDSLVPKLVPGLANVVAVTAGRSHSVAVEADGSAWAWGENTDGKLGDGTTTQRTAPVQVLGLPAVVAVAAGGDHTLGLTRDGQVWSWGKNYYGQLGDGTYTSRYVPGLVSGMAGVTRIAAGGAFSVALHAGGARSGSLWTWGHGGSGQLGYGEEGYAINFNNRPGLALEDVVAFDAGHSHVVALTRMGRALSWGEGSGTYGRLGDGGRVRRFDPVDVTGLADAVSVAAGVYTTAAIRADGSVSMWGYYIPGVASDVPAAVPGLSLADNQWLTQDGDGDNLTAWAEWRHGCDPYAEDSNGDGIRDDIAVALDLSCEALDSDGDGLLDAEEKAAGSSPHRADSDGDGVADGQDCAPLDPSRSQCAVNPSDQTAPLITLLEPPNAIPLP